MEKRRRALRRHAALALLGLALVPAWAGAQACELPAAIRADATMPEHRHGMNYKPSIAVQGGGRFRSEGWMFHMPGRWEFVFEAGGERVTDSVRIE